MLQDANVILAWSGFAFLMLVFKMPFVAETITTGMLRIAHQMRVSRPKTLMERYMTRRRSSASA